MTELNCTELRSLVGYSPRGQKESYTTEQLNNNNNILKIINLRFPAFAISSNLLWCNCIFLLCFSAKTPIFPGSSLTSSEQFLRAI